MLHDMFKKSESSYFIILLYDIILLYSKLQNLITILLTLCFQYNSYNFAHESNQLL